MATKILAAGATSPAPAYTLPQAARLAILSQLAFAKRACRIEAQRQSFMQNNKTDHFGQITPI